MYEREKYIWIREKGIIYFYRSQTESVLFYNLKIFIIYISNEKKHISVCLPVESFPSGI